MALQVGSHYHFFETNPALKFERKKARGMRLDIAAGTAVRFEPGQTREVTLVALAGKRTIYGFRGDVMGDQRIDPDGHRFWTPQTKMRKSHNGQTVVCPSQALGSISGTRGREPLSVVPSY